MKAFVVLREPSNFSQVLKYLDDLGQEDEVHECTIQPYKSKLSANQRRLYWLWLTHISKVLGYTKDELHQDYKKEFLVPIFIRDDKDYAQMVDSVRAIHKKGMPGHAKHLEKQIVKLTSIMDASTSQMTEYLEDIRLKCVGIQIQLPIPEDIGRY